MAQERFEEALDAFAKAQALQPHAPGIYLHQALALAEMERWTEAVESLQQAITLRPHNAVFVMFLGQIFFDQGDYVSARAWCERALAMQPNNSHAIALQALIDLACHHVVPGYHGLTQPLPYPMSLLERGFLWVVRGRIPAVLAHSNHAIQSRLLLVAETYLLRHATLVRPLSQQVVHLFATEERSMLARLYQMLSRGVFGMRRLLISLRYPGRPAVKAAALLDLRADKAIAAGQLAEAALLYRQVLADGTDRPDLHAQLFELSYAHGAFHEALNHLRRVMEQNATSNGGSAVHALLLGELLYIEGHHAQACTHLTRAQALQLQDYKLSYYLGLCQLRKGARHRARRAWRQAVQLLNPAFDPAIAALRLEEMYRVYQLVSGV